MKELEEERKPRVRDDSQVRTLALATKARQALGLPAKSIDWPRLYETVNQKYDQGWTEAEIPWEQIVRASSAGATIFLRRRRSMVVVVNRYGWGWHGEVQYQPIKKRLAAAGDKAGKELTATISTIQTDDANLELRAQPHGEKRIEVTLTLTTLDEPKRGIECQVRRRVRGKEEDKTETGIDGKARFPNIPIGEHEFLCEVTEEREIAIRVVFEGEPQN